MVMEEEALDEETARRVRRTMTGKMCPDRRHIVEKMKRKYSKYGKREKARRIAE